MTLSRQLIRKYNDICLIKPNFKFQISNFRFQNYKRHFEE